MKQLVWKSLWFVWLKWSTKVEKKWSIEKDVKLCTALDHTSNQNFLLKSFWNPTNDYCKSNNHQRFDSIHSFTLFVVQRSISPTLYVQILLKRAAHETFVQKMPRVMCAKLTTCLHITMKFFLNMHLNIKSFFSHHLQIMVNNNKSWKLRLFICSQLGLKVTKISCELPSFLIREKLWLIKPQMMFSMSKSRCRRQSLKSRHVEKCKLFKVS